MLASRETVTKLIPQRPPMVMVDTLIAHNEQHTVTGYTIENDNIFVHNGYFTEAGLIENMAQSAALRTGWLSMLKSGDNGGLNPPVGVIGSVKGFRLYRQAEVNSRLETDIEVVAEIFNASMIKAQIKADGELLAECELKIFTQDQSN
jgi:3-hydroxyacyl-[acyl-carrier-protein] dehydratase